VPAMLRSTTRCRRTETTTPFRTGPAAPDFSGGRSRNVASPLAYPICAETRSLVPFPLLPVMICLPWATPASVTRRTVKSLPILVSSTQCWDPFANAAALAMAITCAGVLPVRPLLVELHAVSPTALTSTAAIAAVSPCLAGPGHFMEAHSHAVISFMIQTSLVRVRFCPETRRAKGP
jgi:hypothetical protein